MPRKRTGARRSAKAKAAKPSAKAKAAKSTKTKNSNQKAITEFIQKREGEILQRKQKRKIKQALQKFRPRKNERGTLVFVGLGGKRVKGKRRKGWVVRVGPRGGKKVIDVGHGLRPSNYKSIRLPQSKLGIKQSKEFYRSRLVKTQAGKAVVKGRGSVKSGGQWDFSDRVVNEIAGNIRKVLQGHKSHRVFLIEAIVSIRKDDGTLKAVEVTVPISKADHINIEIGGIYNFVRQQFYAYLAKQLAFDGYVTSGSANHVRRLKENKRKKRDKWTKQGQLWEGHDYEDVTIVGIEWQIQQLQ